MLQPFRILLPLVFIGLTNCAAQYDRYDTVTALPKNYNQDIINRYLLTKYNGLPFEQMRAIYYFNDKYLMDEVLASGGSDRVGANGLEIVIHCVTYKCNKLILAHNHPGQYFAHPSNIDIFNTEKLRDMLAQANISLIAQIIIGEHDANWLD